MKWEREVAAQEAEDSQYECKLGAWSTSILRFLEGTGAKAGEEKGV